MTALLAWLVNSRIGQSLLLAAGLALAAGVSYRWAYHRGELACQSRQMAARVAAQQRQQDATEKAEVIADTARTESTAQRVQNANKTAEAVQRVRHAETINPGPDCTLPDSVRGEGREAVAGARAARGL